MKEERLRILLVDDHALVRAGLKTLIEQIDGFTVSAEAYNIASAIGKLAEMTPDIVVTDIDMGTDSGLDLAEKIRAQHPTMPIAILSMHSSEELISRALQIGVSAYLLKEAAPEELGVALKAIARGETFLSPAVSTKLIHRLARNGKTEADPIKQLTDRQVQILTMLAKGMGTKEIAFQLDLSDKTVAAHRAQIMERIGIRDLAGLVLFAVKHGLVRVGKP